MTSSFHDAFTTLFDAQYPRLFRYLDRLCGDAAAAADLAQEAFVRLYRRGAMPDVPVAWLVTVAMNRFRSARVTARRRARLLTVERGAETVADAPASPERHAEAADESRRVRAVLAALSERDRGLLSLLAEGYSYREMATALDLHEESVGTLLARAKRAFRERYGETPDAP